MTYFQAIILGIVQGITEFLPISSSAHLVLVPYLLKWEIPLSQVFPFDVLVQIGTLLAVIIYFRKDLWEIIVAVLTGLRDRHPFSTPQARLGWYLVLASIPAGIAGLILKEVIERAFSDPRASAGFLFVTAALLVMAELIGHRNRALADVTWKDSLVIGFFQVLSLFPGVSRSGSTIAGGMSRHLDRRTSGQFAFLMSVPIMLAAGVASLPDLFETPDLSSFLPVVGVGFIISALVGYFSIHWLLSLLNRRRLYGFAIYCAVIAIIILLIPNA